MHAANDISHIYKFIYISNYETARDIKTLKLYNINAILYIGTAPKPDRVIDMYKANGIIYKFIKMSDAIDVDITNCCDIACDFINTNAKHRLNILVHCKCGISRSPTVVACYLMRLLYATKKNRPDPILNDILDLIHLYRPCSNPNINFITQLKQHEKQICEIKCSSNILKNKEKTLVII